MSRREERLLDHNFDGIQEYDNPTPGWWHALFIGSVLFSAVYAVFWHSSEISWTPFDSLADERRGYYRTLFAGIGELKGDEPTIRDFMDKSEWMALGQSLFASNCAQCHGIEGNGINCPNLTDDQYINCETLGDLYSVISAGVTTKGMPAWEARLSVNERVLLASYVATLRDAPKPGRAAEGNVIPPFRTKTAAGGAPPPIASR
jgi:cytochrome c oxidase cbb3-type subunit 3